MGATTEAGVESGLLKFQGSLEATEGFFVGYEARNIILSVSSLGGIAWLFVLFSTVYEHKRALAKRFSCDLSAALILNRDTPRLVTAKASDVSRLRLKVQWSNTHYFGVQFTRPFSERRLAKLLGDAASRTPVSRGTRANRAK